MALGWDQVRPTYFEKNVPPGSGWLRNCKNMGVCPYWSLVEKAEVLLGNDISKIMSGEQEYCGTWSSNTDDNHDVPGGPNCECERVAYTLMEVIRRANLEVLRQIKGWPEGKTVRRDSSKGVACLLPDYSHLGSGVQCLEKLTKGVKALREAEKEAVAEELTPLQVVRIAESVLEPLMLETMGIRKGFIPVKPGCSQKPEKLLHGWRD